MHKKYFKMMNKKIAGGIALGIILLLAIAGAVFLHQDKRSEINMAQNANNETELRNEALFSAVDREIRMRHNEFENITVEVDKVENKIGIGRMILEDFDVVPSNKNHRLKKYFAAFYDSADQSWSVAYEWEGDDSRPKLLSDEQLVEMKNLLSKEHYDGYKFGGIMVKEVESDFAKIIAYEEDFSTGRQNLGADFLVLYRDGKWSIIKRLNGNKMSCSTFTKLGLPEKFKVYSYCGVETELTSNWEIVSGDPNDTCTYPTYNGEATIKSWYVYDYSYVSKEWLVEFSGEDLSKIFKNPAEFKFKPQLKLIDMDQGLEEKLKKSSKDNPVEITIRGLYFYCEGTINASVSPAD